MLVLGGNVSVSGLVFALLGYMSGGSRMDTVSGDGVEWSAVGLVTGQCRF
jgi:hypothetical protein